MEPIEPSEIKTFDTTVRLKLRWISTKIQSHTSTFKTKYVNQDCLNTLLNTLYCNQWLNRDYYYSSKEYIDAYKAVVPDSQPTNNTKVSTQLGQEKNIAKYRHQYIVAVEEETGENTEMKITAMYSTVPLNSPPLAVNLATRAMLKIANPNSSQTISVENHPLKSGFPDVCII